MPMPPPRIPARHKYTALLVVLVTSVVLQSLRSALRMDEVALDLVAAALAVAIYVTVFRGTREQRLMAVVLAVIVVIGLIRDLVPSHHERAWALAFQSLASVYLCFSVAAILRDLFGDQKPGRQNILGAICGYLIAGAAVGNFNIIAYVLAPSSFAVDPNVAELVRDWHGRMSVFQYYAFTQLLTIGYAEVTPLRAPATTLSLLAAIFGVFYTAVVVSQLVAVAQSDRQEG
jgi:hypothetical protein